MEKQNKTNYKQRKDMNDFENKDFRLIGVINKTNRRFKALVILYGPADNGKTSILKKFICGRSGLQYKQKGDIRFSFQSNNQEFCVCTGGDDREICEKNCFTFDLVAARVDTPLICISAARIGNGSSSISDVFDYYSRKIREDCYITLWINVKELLVTAAKQAGILGYDKSKDLKVQAKNGLPVEDLTDKACDILEKQIQEIEKL